MYRLFVIGKPFYCLKMYMYNSKQFSFWSSVYHSHEYIFVFVILTLIFTYHFKALLVLLNYQKNTFLASMHACPT